MAEFKTKFSLEQLVFYCGSPEKGVIQITRHVVSEISIRQRGLTGTVVTYTLDGDFTAGEDEIFATLEEVQKSDALLALDQVQNIFKI